MSHETFRKCLYDSKHACKLAHFGNVSFMDEIHVYSDSIFSVCICRSRIEPYSHFLPVLSVQ